MEKREKFSRRDALKASAGLVGVGMVPTTASAQNESNSNGVNERFKNHIQQANQMLDDGHSRHERKEFLKNRGYSSGGERSVVEMEKDDSESDVGTESFDPDELDITARLWNGCSGGDYYAELIWEYEWEGTSNGSFPSDRVGIGYEPQWWDYASNTISGSTETSYGVEPEESEFGDGPAFSVQDAFANPDDTFWAGVYLDPVGDYGTDERRIKGAYSHLWEGVEITSVDVGLPAGISVGVINNTYEWTTPTEIDGDTFLQVSQSDSVFCS